VVLLDADKSLLLIVDIQERLAPAMTGESEMIDRAARLMRAAGMMEIPVLVSEQYPKGLGPTVEEIAGLAPDGAIRDKLHFSCAHDPDLREAIQGANRPHVLVAGIEAHVCVLQTAIGLKAMGLEVAVAADAVASRHEGDKTQALERMAAHSVDIVTSEMAVFEWLHTAGDTAFKRVSALVK
jgi:nicotinamidase-related amidase